MGFLLQSMAMSASATSPVPRAASLVTKPANGSGVQVVG